jgi:carboxypeptidase C (cathepsin A)
VPQDTHDLEWFVDGEHAGYWRTARNLTFVKIANASHMVRFVLTFLKCLTPQAGPV